MLTEKYADTMQHWPVLRCDRGTLAFGLLAVALAAFGLSRLHTDDDIRSLQNPPKHLVDEQIKLSQLLDVPAPAQFYLVRGPTAEAVLQREEVLRERLEPHDRKAPDQRLSGDYRIGCLLCTSRASTGNLIQNKLLNDGGRAQPAGKNRLGEDDKWVSRSREASACIRFASFTRKFF